MKEAGSVGEDILSALYRPYADQMAAIPGSACRSREQFAEWVSPALAQMRSVRALEDGRTLGAMFWQVWEENGITHCCVPVFGCFAQSEKILARMFQRLAEDAAKTRPCSFSVHLYAREQEQLQLFSMMQFGIQAEKQILRIGDGAWGDFDIRTLTKAETEARWGEIWQCTAAIIDHLRSSPVFYPGEEFTEAVYREFFLDEETCLHAAFDGAGRIIGIIETNAEPDGFACAAPSANVGEIYTLPAYRGTGLAEALLRYAAAFEKTRGIPFLWVEHGTANPNARGFWNKHFVTYRYELVRDIGK